MTIAKLKLITLDRPPTEDLVESDFQEIFGADLDLIPFPSNDPARPDITSSQQQMIGFSTEISSVDSIAGPVRLSEIVTFPTGAEPPAGDTIRNTWGFQGEEPAGIEALLGTNVGAAVDNETDTQQFMLPIMLPLMLGVYIGFATVINDPHGTVATVFSMIPFTRIV